MKHFIKAAVLGMAALLATGCEQCSSGTEKKAGQDQTTSSAPAGDSTAPADATTTTGTTTAGGEGSLAITDIKVGTGAEATDGRKVTVNYTGTLADGTQFDSTKDRAPFNFVLGSGMVIAGWDQGVKGMKEGGVRKLVIPPHLAYGSRAVGGVIPPNSTLHFEIELLKVEAP